MDTAKQNFLAALGFSAGEDSPILDASIFDYDDKLVEAVSAFISGFRDYLESKGIEPLDDSPRSFGGNVFFSLSGHGVGFWDEGTEQGDANQAALEAYAGGRHRFEGLADDLDFEDDGGEINFAVYPQFLDERRARYFSV